jgi:hypothetical protein
MTAPEDLLASRFYQNMNRITGLVKLIHLDVDSLRPSGLQSHGVRADILRAIVVFLHATFEDVLRTTARQRLPVANSEVLDKIPLVGTSRSRRAEKFHLGALNTHRGKAVDDVIQESVENYLDRESFSSCADVDEILTQMGLDTGPFKPFYSDLDLMMKRRHRIVHEADLASPSHSVSVPWGISDDFTLAIWLLIVMAFYAQLRVAVDPTDEFNRLIVVRRLKAIEIANSVRAEIAVLQVDSTRSTLIKAQEASERLTEVIGFLGPPSVEELFVIWKNQKSADDQTSEEEARARLAAICSESTQKQD